MKRILFFFLMLATFASAQTDSTDILITIREDGDTTQVGRWRAGMPVLIRSSWDGWGEREKQGDKFVIIRLGIAKARIDSFLVAHTDSTSGLRRKYQLSRAAIQFVKNNRDANNVVRVTPAQLRNAFKRANRLRRFGEPQRMDILSKQQFVRWRNMLIGATATSATVNTDGGGDYTSLAAAEAGEQKDLVTANEVLTIYCSGTTEDVTAVTFLGWTTGNSNYVEVVGNNTSGVWDEAAYKFNNANVIVTVQIANIVLKNLQFKKTSTTGAACVYALTGASVIDCQNSVFVYTGPTGDETGIRSNVAATINAKNNILKDLDYGFIAVAGTFFCYNNTFYNIKITALWRSGGSIVAKNTITQNCADSYLSGITGDYNIDDNGDTQMPGLNSITATVNFADTENGNFRLLEGSSGIDQGVDLSSDPSYPFNTAIDGTVRPQGAAWDIGAFEYVQPATNTDKKSRFNGFGRGFNGGWKK